MRVSCALVVALSCTGCSLNFDVFDPAAGGSGDASSPDAAEAGADSAGNDAATEGGAACSAGMAACGSACMSSCGACNGGTDFVTCLVCNDGGPPALVCAPADPGGFCLSGSYAHCSCQQDSDCMASNQRCTNNQCTACGEPLFDQNHTRCSTGGNCCKTGTMLGHCSC